MKLRYIALVSFVFLFIACDVQDSGESSGESSTSNCTFSNTKESIDNRKAYCEVDKGGQRLSLYKLNGDARKIHRKFDKTTNTINYFPIQSGVSRTELATIFINNKKWEITNNNDGAEKYTVSLQ